MEKNNFRFFGIFITLAIIVLSLYFVYAYPEQIAGLIIRENVTSVYDEGSFFVNWTSDTGAKGYNVTIWVNSSGSNVFTFWKQVNNDSLLGYHFSNTTVDANYTFHVYAYNSTGIGTNSTNISMYVDATAPTITIASPSAGWIGDNIIYIYANATDSTLNVTDTTIYFWFENSTGNFSKTIFTSCPYVSAATGFNCSYTFDTNNLTDGNYTLWVNASDTIIGNVKNQSLLLFGVDNTAPSSVTLAKTSSTRTSLNISISIVDAHSGIISSCTAAGSGTESISGTGASQTLIVTGLSCGRTYSYIVTCNDRSGNSGASSSTSFSTTGCSGGAPTTTKTWTHTYTPSDEQVAEGYTKELGIKNRVKVKIGTTYHHVGVSSLTATSATIEIASDPVQVTLDVGEDAKVDVTDDGFYDIYVLLNAIVNSKADVTIQKIHEEIPEGAGPVATAGEVAGEEEEEEEEEAERNLLWLWILIAVVVLVVIIGGGIALKKKSQ